MNPIARIAVAAGLTAAALLATSTPAHADPLINGSGSTWVQIAMNQWTSDATRLGITVDYQGIGSTAGRQNYMYGLTDFAGTEIPYQADELAQFQKELGTRFRQFQYTPTVAGGTGFMYNLVDPATGQRITRLKMSTRTIALVWTGGITSWRDPAIVADNPGVNLPDIPLVPVVRSDSSGTSGQLALYLEHTSPDVWGPFASANGCAAPCANWPTSRPFVGQNLSAGVTNYVASTPGTINYVEAGYALAKNFPVVFVQNASGNFTQPLAGNISTALTHARLNDDLTQDLREVYVAPEANAYPVSSYSYVVTPTSNIAPDRGAMLGRFLLYVACAGQRNVARLGYAPLPENLVNVVFDAIRRINGAPAPPDISTTDGRAQCPNPTLAAGGPANVGDDPDPAAPQTPAGGGGPAPATPAAGQGGGAAQTPAGGAAPAATGTKSGGTSAKPGAAPGSAATATTVAATATTTAGTATTVAGASPDLSGADQAGTFDDSAAFGDAPQEASAADENRLVALAAVKTVSPKIPLPAIAAVIYLPLLVFAPVLLFRRRRSQAEVA